MGLAVLDADPANPSGMAWCNMGGEYDSAKNTLGYTEPTDYCVNCRCICCDPNNHCNDEAKIACRVHIRLKVYVYKTHLDTAPERTRRLFGDISRIYGHEQLHVRNLLAIAQVIKDSLTKLESTYGCQNVRDCAINATRIEANAKQLLHQDVWGEGHKPRTPRVRPSPLPEENTPYDPMGGVFPRTSDCTKPNTVNPFDPGKECRTRE